jgi:hypothetical protein
MAVSRWEDLELVLKTEGIVEERLSVDNRRGHQALKSRRCGQHVLELPEVTHNSLGHTSCIYLNILDLIESLRTDSGGLR